MADIDSKNRIKNFYRIGRPKRELHLLREYPNCSFGIVVNAHTGIYTPAIIEFIKKHKTIFFIDPMTYAFGRNLIFLKKMEKDGTWSIRKTYGKLLNQYGKWFKDITMEKLSKNKDLYPEDFMKDGEWDDTKIEDFSNRILHFQKNFIFDERQRTLEELQELADLEVRRDLRIKPRFLVAPYFYFENTGDKWFELNVKMFDYADKQKGEYEIWGVICTSKENFLQMNISNIMGNFKNADGFLIWISDFNEYSTPKHDLDRYVSVIKELKGIGKPVINLHGGFLSAILSKSILAGYCSGICYGESKNIDVPPPTEGMPKRLYMKFIHKKLLLDFTKRILVDKKELLCNCNVCKSIIEKNPGKRDNIKINNYIKVMEEDETRRLLHFLKCRESELKYIGAHDINGIIKALKKDSKTVEKIPSFEKDYLTIWREVLENLLSTQKPET